MGAGDYSMRIWLKPDIMRAYKITASEVLAAIQDQNIESAPGELGANGNQTFQFSLKYTGKLKTAEEFGNIIIRTEATRILRVKDVADVELGSQSYNIFTKGNGSPAAVFGIKQAAGSNASDIIKDAKARMEIASKSFPEGIRSRYERVFKCIDQKTDQYPVCSFCARFPDNTYFSSKFQGHFDSCHCSTGIGNRNIFFPSDVWLFN